MPGFFKKFIFKLEAFSYIKMDWGLAKQLMSLQKMFSILIRESPVYTTLITLPFLMIWGDDLGCNNIQKHGEQAVLQNYLYDEDTGVREETIFSIFRRNIFLHDSYQAHEVVIETRKWKQKFLGICVKSFSSLIKCVGDIGCILNKLYHNYLI